ncbi:hypothetical protein BC936DRAFT_149145 [Jimgerdemannia flammicorona]|uniref:Uncharacterized protein n=1 Tax=Jimgerdemannia flammicorona TaxID=994334 RepID=A0A433D1G9_9FUNG|nr:hypothetical protein BC936DRAFT_149145 [Jimgerdemannia flammicorona]
MSRMATAKSTRSSETFLRCAAGRPPDLRPMMASRLSMLCLSVPLKSHFWPTLARNTTDRSSFRRTADAQQQISPLKEGIIEG